MTPLSEIWAVTKPLKIPAVLEHLLRDRFKGRTAVTASLRARSVVALQLVAEIDPTTPVIFCHAGPLYPESEQYRNELIDRLGLTDVRTPLADEADCVEGDLDHVEWVMASSGLGRVRQAIHLNHSLGDFDAWISAAYHDPTVLGGRHRVDVEGRLYRINPLLRWSKEQVRRFMRARELPYHAFVGRDAETPPPPENAEKIPSYHF